MHPLLVLAAALGSVPFFVIGFESFAPTALLFFLAVVLMRSDGLSISSGRATGLAIVLACLGSALLSGDRLIISVSLGIMVATALCLLLTRTGFIIATLMGGLVAAAFVALPFHLSLFAPGLVALAALLREGAMTSALWRNRDRALPLSMGTAFFVFALSFALLYGPVMTALVAGLPVAEAEVSCGAFRDLCPEMMPMLTREILPAAVFASLPTHYLLSLGFASLALILVDTWIASRHARRPVRTSVAGE